MTKLADFLIPDIGKNNHEVRRQWVIDQLKLIFPKTRLLDAGAGVQQLKKACTHLEYVSQDFAQYLPSDKQTGLQNPEWDYGNLDIISDYGFTNIELVPNGSYFEYLAQEVHRLNGVSKRYTIKQKGLNLYQKVISLLFMRLLNKQFKKDTTSNDLLCYGYFVKCTKI